MPAKSSAPLNYTTMIEPVKSAADCTSILAMHGAQQISSTWQGGEPIGLKFVIITAFGPRIYSLPINVTGTHKALIQAANKGRIPRSKATEEQAKRVAWRVMHDWLKIQLSLIEAGVAEFAQVMLPYMHTEDGADETVWDRVRDQYGQLAIEG